MEYENDYLSKIEMYNDQLNSICEMKLINLYKSFEIEIKRILELAYPTIDKKIFYRWDVFVSFLKTKKINVKQIESYEEVNQLRIVNNQLKHDGRISNELKSITEFSKSEGFTHESILTFHT